MFPCVFGAKNKKRESKAARKMARVKERGGGGEEREGTILDRPKPKIPFLGLSLFRNQTETLATQAKIYLKIN